MNTSLHKAKQAKNDEFYTRYEDIEKELQHYTEHFKDKVVYCNCDSPKHSNFWKYFVNNFEVLGLKRLIATYYKEGKATYKTEYFGNPGKAIHEYEQEMNHKIFTEETPNYTPNCYKTVIGNGDFRSSECISILQEADIIVSNPPFSMWREYISLLMNCNKKFLIIGNDNAITYKDFFPHLKANEVWKGVTHPKEFIQPDGSVKKFGNISWFTNLEHSKRQEFIPLTAHYDPEKYPKFDNYDAINVDKTKDIPCDYYGVMGVPISFLDRFNPDQFEIVAFRKGDDGQDLVFSRGERTNSTLLSHPCQTAQHGLITGASHTKCQDGKSRYARVAIQRLSQ